ncbi:MAG: DEAD/DEAH box helicase [Bacilli bacterium]
MKFNSCNLSQKMLDTLNDLKIIEMTKIQEEVIPLALKNKNVVGISDTGSGKTYAFLIPIIEKIDVNIKEVQAVIISPTRELATQLYYVCLELVNNYNSEIKVGKFVGGSDKKTSKLTSQIVIGTPGRLHDLFIKENLLRIDQTRTLVIDEADMVFEDNYIHSIDEIKGKLTKNDILYMVFSATINSNLSSFLKKYLKNTKIIDCSTVKGINSNVMHILIKSKYDRKDQKLLEILQSINPYTCLIFASKKTEVDRLYNLLSNYGYKVGMIHGNMQPRQRNRVMKDMLNDRYQYLVASDIASRGIDLEMVTHVISYDLPSELIFYSHRSGRTGRFNSNGISILLYDEKDLVSINKIQKTGIDFKYYHIIKNELVEKKEFFFKKNKKGLDVIITNKERKVKPGYKKKQKDKFDKAKKKSNRKVR